MGTIIETTEKDFEEYKKHVKAWINYFGLKQYEVFFKYDELDQCFASCKINAIDKVVSFEFNKRIDIKAEYEIEDDWIYKSAFHEVCHLLLADLYELATSRYVQPVDIDIAEHAIIRILENTLLKTPTTN